jgi:hypothetical protein
MTYLLVIGGYKSLPLPLSCSLYMFLDPSDIFDEIGCNDVGCI